MKKLLYLLLGLLGFSACSEGENSNKTRDDIDNIPCMYGTPTVEFTIKGKVTDSAGVPIKGIVVSSDRNSDLSAVTGEDGSFTTNKVRAISIYGTLTFTDTDGDANGGDFATKDVSVENLPTVKIKDGEGWYNGEYEVTADVKLTKK